MIWAGFAGKIDPNGPFPDPLETKRDSCERDRVDGMLLNENHLILIELKVNSYRWDDWLYVVIKGCGWRFSRSSFVALFVRFNELLFILDGNKQFSIWFDLLLVDDRPKKWENFVFDCLVVVVMEEGRSDNESIHDGINLMYLYKWEEKK
jgi:hypothetical protein